ncbi:hypothetical protein [Flavobacterium sp. XS2P39]|uniref:hypothetical protein n=1 Tax=Flavobacterium sp. XS2P39 TaxID=3401725 RepID=UPI003AAAB46B
MLDFNYYVVTSYVNGFPYFTTCASIDDVFYRISDLEKFISDAKSGVSDEKIEPLNFKLISSKHFTI